MSQHVEDRRGQSVSRIDQPHAVDSGDSPVEDRAVAAEVVAAASGSSEFHATDQLRLQAGQLAGHLRARLRDLDQREAHLNARIAQLENELRTSRLWIGEREHEFIQREQELQQQIAELKERVHLLSTEEFSAKEDRRRLEDDLEQRECNLAEREKRLLEGQQCLVEETGAIRAAREESRQVHEEAERALALEKQQWEHHQETVEERHRCLAAELERQRATLKDQEKDLQTTQHQERVVELDRIADRLRERERQFEKSDQHLNKNLAELAQERQELLQQRQRTQEDAAEQRHLLTEQRSRLEREWEEANNALASRRERLDHRETAVEQLRGEATRIQRETLEMRLVMEELWGQICEQASAVEVTQSVSQLRRRLVDHFSVERHELQQQKVTLVEISARLDAKHQGFRQQRAELETWLSCREQAIEEQAARLVAREQELNEQQLRCDQIEQACSVERRELQREIRGLRGQLREQQAPIA